MSNPLRYKVKKRVTAVDPLEYKKIEDVKINLNQTRAFEFLELATFPGERPVRERHVQYLYDEMVSGRFLWDNVILATAECSEDNKTYRINGQHTCWARVNLDDSAKVEVRSCRYRVENMTKVKELYSVFDRNAPRTNGHISKILLMDTNASRDIPNSIISRLVSGFKIHFSESEGGAFNPEEITAIITSNHSELFNKVGHFARVHYEDGVWIRRSSVLGAMFSTFESSEAKSNEFWTPVCDGVGLMARTDARWALRNYLTTHSMSSVGGSETVGPETMYRVCINAWNHWRRNKEVSVLRSTETRIKAI